MSGRRPFVPNVLAWLVGLSAARPGRVVATILVAAALAAVALPRLRTQGSIYQLFPAEAGPIADLALYGRTFGADRDLLLLVSGGDRAAVERTVGWLREQLSRSPLFTPPPSASALARVVRSHLFALLPQQDWGRARRHLTTDLEQRVERLRRLLLAPLTPDRELVAADPLGLAAPLVERWLAAASPVQWSADGRTALLGARPRGKPGDLVFAEQLDNWLRGLRERRPDGRVQLQFGGGVRYALFLAQAIQRDLRVSSLVALVGAALFFLVFFRSLWILPAALSIGALAVLFTLAVAALTVGHVSAISLSFAAICIGLGLDAAIHLVCRMREFAGAPLVERLQRAAGAVGPALLASSATTVLAFAAFGTSAFVGLAETGLLAAAGLLFTLILTVLLLPALLVLLPGRSVEARSGPLDRLLTRIGEGGARGAWVTLAIALVLVLGALPLARGLRINERLAALAPADLPPARVDRQAAQALGRARHRLIALVRAPDAEQALRANDRLAGMLAALERRGEIAGYRSLSPLLPSLATQRARIARLEQIDAGASAARLRAALRHQGLRPAAFAGFLAALERPELLRPDRLPAALAPIAERALSIGDEGAVVATVVQPRERSGAGIIARLGALTAGRATVSVTGAEQVGKAMAGVLRRDLSLLAGVATLVVLAVLWLLLRRASAVLAALLSLGTAGLLFCGALALLGIALDLYTLMTIPLLIGYGVDDHIYIARQALDDGIGAALARSGRAVLATTATSAMALGALMLCRVDGLRALGLAAVIGLLLSMLTSLLLLPALLRLLGGGRGTTSGRP